MKTNPLIRIIAVIITIGFIITNSGLGAVYALRPETVDGKAIGDMGQELGAQGRAVTGVVDSKAGAVSKNLNKNRTISRELTLESVERLLEQHRQVRFLQDDFLNDLPPRVLNDSEFKVLYNPKRDPDEMARFGIRKPEKCFLCPIGMDEREKRITWQGRKEWHVYSNPNPILRDNIVIASEEHIDQHLDEAAVGDMIDITLLLNNSGERNSYRIFYNDLGVGSSIPWHNHMQGIPVELPIENYIENEKNKSNKELIVTDDNVSIYGLKNYPSMDVDASVFVVEGSEKYSEKVSASCYKIINLLDRIGLRYNILTTRDKSGKLRVFIFPRRRHLPSNFGKFWVSPATIEMAGMIVISRKELYEEFELNDFKNLFKDVGISWKDVAYVIDSFKSDGRDFWTEERISTEFRKNLNQIVEAGDAVQLFNNGDLLPVFEGRFRLEIQSFLCLLDQVDSNNRNPKKSKKGRAPPLIIYSTERSLPAFVMKQIEDNKEIILTGNYLYCIKDYLDIKSKVQSTKYKKNLQNIKFLVFNEKLICVSNIPPIYRPALQRSVKGAQASNPYNITTLSIEKYLAVVKKRSELKEPDLVIIYHGRVAQDKDFGTFIDVVKGVNDEFKKRGKVLSVEIYGGSSGTNTANIRIGYEMWIKDKVNSLELQDVVTFHGPYIADDLPEIYGLYPRGKRIFLLTTRHEGFGIAIVEAMMASTPVVVSNIGGVPEIFKAVEGYKAGKKPGIPIGILVDCGENNDDKRDNFVKAILELSEKTPKGLREMGERGQEVALIFFSESEMVREYLKVFRQCLGINEKEPFKFSYIGIGHFPYNAGGIAEVAKALFNGIKKEKAADIELVIAPDTSSKIIPVQYRETFDSIENKLCYSIMKGVGNEDRLSPTAEIAKEKLLPYLEVFIEAIRDLELNKTNLIRTKLVEGEKKIQLSHCLYKMWEYFQAYNYDETIAMDEVKELFEEVINSNKQINNNELETLRQIIFYQDNLNTLKSKIPNGDVLYIERDTCIGFLGVIAKIKKPSSILIFGQHAFGIESMLEKIASEESPVHSDNAKDLLRKFYLLIRSINYSFADKVISVSDGLRERTIRDFEVDKSKVVTIHNGVGDSVAELTTIIEDLKNFNPYIRRKAIEQLRNYDNITAVRLLIGRTFDDDRENSYLARDILINMKNENVNRQLLLAFKYPEIFIDMLPTDNLIALLEKNPEHVILKAYYLRESTAYMLGKRKATEVVDDLIKRLEYGSDNTYVKASIIKSLGRIGGEKAITKLLELLRVEDKFIQDIAVEAILFLEKHEIPIERIREFLSEDKNLWVKRGAIEVLRKFKDESLRKVCVQILQKKKGELKKEDELVIESLIYAIGDLGLKNLKNKIISILKDDNELLSFRIASAVSLGRLADNSDLSVLEEVISKSFLSDLNLNAIKSIGIVGTDEAVNLLLKFIDSKSVIVKVAAIRVSGELLSSLGNTQLKNNIQEKLKKKLNVEENRIVFGAIVEALEKIGVNIDPELINSHQLISIQNDIGLKLKEFFIKVPEIKYVTIKRSSFSRGVFLEASDLDELIIYHYAIAKEKLDELRNKLVVLLKEAGIYIKQAPIFEDPEWIELESEEKTMPIPVGHIIVYSENEGCKFVDEQGIFKACDDIGSFKYLGLNTPPVKFEQRTELLLLLGELSNDRFSKLLRSNEEIPVYVQGVRSRLEELRNKRLSSSAASFARRLHSLVTQNMLYEFPSSMIVRKGQIKTVVDDIKILVEAKLVRVEKNGVIRIEWMKPQFGSAEVKLLFDDNEVREDFEKYFFGSREIVFVAVNGFSISVPADIANDVIMSVQELRKTLPVIMINREDYTISYSEGPITYSGEGVSYRTSGNIESQYISYKDLEYLGTDVRTLAVNKKVLIIANSNQEAEAKKAEILKLNDMGFLPDNIKIAGSRKELEASISEEEFDFVIIVDKILYDLQGLSLPKIFMEYRPDELQLRKRLEDSTLVSSV